MQRPTFEGRRLLVGLGLAALLPTVPATARGQATDGTAATAIAGAALGFYSSTLLGIAGSIVSCTQTYVGARCLRQGAVTAGALGLATGALLGAGDRERLGDRALSAGIGFLAGSAAGLALKPLAQRFGWHDVLTVGLLGGAIGAEPLGSAIGFGVGATVGVILWQVIPEATFPDALAAALAGMALGGLTAWAIDGIEAGSGAGAGATRLIAPLRIWF